MSFQDVPIGAAFDVRNGATPASAEPRYWDGDIPWVGPADLGKLKTRFIDSGERSITPEGYGSCGTQMVPAGSIILSIRAPIGHIAVASQPMCFNQGCRGLVPRPMVRSDFAYWALSACKPGLEAAGQGTTFIELARDKLRAERIPLPDLETQKVIADFLDRVTARIDQLIEKKQRLVELLKEKHDAQITSEVTGTVSGASSRKISRSPFIHTIPEGWEDAEIKHLVQPGTSITYGIVQAGPEFEGGIPYIRTGDMKGDDLPISGYPLTSPEIEQSYARSRMERGDLVIAIRATVGKCLRLPDELIGANLTQGTAKISPGPRIDREFMFFAIRSMPSQAFFEESSKGATFKEITLDRLRRLVLPLPPRDAQRAIVQRLLKAEDIFRRVKWATIESGERLREFRSALITAAVTGQIDIGAWRQHGNTDRRLEQIEEEMRT